MFGRTIRCAMISLLGPQGWEGPIAAPSSRIALMLEPRDLGEPGTGLRYEFSRNVR